MAGWSRGDSVEIDYIQASPLPAGHYPPGGVALFPLHDGFRDVEDLLAERGIEVSYKTIRCWTIKFGPAFASNLKRRRMVPSGRWHLDEMMVKIRGQRMWMWRAVDDEAEVLDVLVQKRRNKAAALKLLKNQGVRPEKIVTDGAASYWAALTILGCVDRHKPGRLRDNNRVCRAAIWIGTPVNQDRNR